MEIENITAQVSASLTYYLEAQKLHAANIANINNSDYTPLEIDFDKFMSTLDSQVGLSSDFIDTAVESATSVKSDSVSLDDQIAQSEIVSMKYGELLEVLGRNMSLYSIAMNKGR